MRKLLFGLAFAISTFSCKEDTPIFLGSFSINGTTVKLIKVATNKQKDGSIAFAAWGKNGDHDIEIICKFPMPSATTTVDAGDHIIDYLDLKESSRSKEFGMAGEKIDIIVKSGQYNVKFTGLTEYFYSTGPGTSKITGDLKTY